MPNVEYKSLLGADGSVYGGPLLPGDLDAYQRRAPGRFEARMDAIKKAYGGDLFGALTEPFTDRLGRSAEQLGGIGQALGGDVKGALPDLVGKNRYDAIRGLYRGVSDLFGGGAAATEAGAALGAGGGAAAAAETGATAATAAQGAAAAAESEGFAVWLAALLA